MVRTRTRHIMCHASHDASEAAYGVWFVHPTLASPNSCAFQFLAERQSLKCAHRQHKDYWDHPRDQGHIDLHIHKPTSPGQVIISKATQCQVNAKLAHSGRQFRASQRKANTARQRPHAILSGTSVHTGTSHNRCCLSH